MGENRRENTHSMALKVNIKSWHAVGAWKWNVEDDSCGICRLPFDSFCSNCKMPGDDCPLVWGKCSHAFHMHCIMRWLQKNQEGTCCMCRRPWEFQDENDRAPEANEEEEE